MNVGSTCSPLSIRTATAYVIDSGLVLIGVFVSAAAIDEIRRQYYRWRWARFETQVLSERQSAGATEEWPRLFVIHSDSDDASVQLFHHLSREGLRQQLVVLQYHEFEWRTYEWTISEVEERLQEYALESKSIGYALDGPPIPSLTSTVFACAPTEVNPIVIIPESGLTEGMRLEIRRLREQFNSPRLWVYMPGTGELRQSEAAVEGAENQTVIMLCEPIGARVASDLARKIRERLFDEGGRVCGGTFEDPNGCTPSGQS